MRTHNASGTQPRHAQPHVRAVHQGRRHRHEHERAVQEEVCDDVAVQAGRRVTTIMMGIYKAEILAHTNECNYFLVQAMTLQGGFLLF